MVLAAYCANFDGRIDIWMGALQNWIDPRRRFYACHVQPHTIRRFSGPGTHNRMIETIRWTDAGVVMIDQTRLPHEERYVTCTDYRQVADAIRPTVIRGAPAIGVAAAMGIALGMKQAESLNEFEEICETLARTPPTAVNL